MARRKRCICPRCGKFHYYREQPFVSKFCLDCQLRNDLDEDPDLKTPPHLIDKFTKRPCLTWEEYLKDKSEHVKRHYTEIFDIPPDE